PTVSGGVSQSSGMSTWSPDGQFIAARNNNALVVWRFTGAAVVIMQSQSSAEVPSSGRGAFWSPDGRFLYTVAASSVAGKRVAAYEWNGSSLSEPVYPIDQPTSLTINSSSLSSDGKQLVVGLGGNNPGQALYVYNVDGTELILRSEVR